MSHQTPTPRAGRRISDALIRNQLRGQNNPRRAGRWTGLLFTLVLFPVMAALLFAIVGGDHPAYLLIFIAFLVAMLLGALAGVLTTAIGHRVVGPNPLPTDADPADVRAARKVVRSGEPSGDPEVDRLARIVAAQGLETKVQSPTVFRIYFWFLAGLCVVQTVFRYQLADGWDWLTLANAVMALFFAGFAVVFPRLLARARRRLRAFAEVYDAHSEADSEAGSELGSDSDSANGQDKRTQEL